MKLNMLNKAQTLKSEAGCVYNDESVIKALRTVTTYLIADVFDLTSEETMWAGYHIDLAFSCLREERYQVLPAPVTLELKNSYYSDKLREREEQEARPIPASDEVRNATLDDWTDVFMETILVSYPSLRPLNEAKIKGYLSGLLEELGVSHPKSPRGSKYLPNTVINFLARRDT